MTDTTETEIAVREPLDDETFKSFFQKKKDNDETIESIEQFDEFRDNFLKTFRPHMTPAGTATARECDELLCQELETLAKACLATKNMAKEGKITPESTTVKGQKSIADMTTAMKSCEQSVDKYLPKTSNAEKQAGYTKFELAAVLIKDGFRAYGLMAATRDYAAAMVSEGGALSEVLNDGQLQIAMYYFTALEAFCETMADLGMYEVMEKLTELYKIRPRARKKKKKQFDRNDGRDALSDSEHEKGAAATDEPDQEEGPMFENRIKDRPANQKSRAIIDKGWSLGFAPGEQITDPNSKKGKSKKKKKKDAKNKKPKSLRSKGGESGDAASVDTADTGDGDGTSGDPNDAAASSKPSSSKKKKGKGGEPSSDNDKDGTETTDDEEDDDDGEDDGSSSEEEDDEDDDDEDDDYIYYFDPVQQIVGKLPRTACATEKLILLTSELPKQSSKETHDGIVEDWDTKDEENPGKTDLIITMKEVLRGKATDKVDGLQD